MFSEEAIERLTEAESISATSIAVQSALEGLGALALPEHFKVHDLEPFMTNRRRPRATVITQNIRSFCDYIKVHKEAGATVFFHAAEVRAVAILDLGDPSEPGHAENRAIYAPERSAAYRALCEIAGGHSRQQVTVAEFIEDWKDEANITCEHSDQPVTAAEAIQAIRKVTIETAKKVESAEERLSVVQSSFEQVTASGTDTAKLPTFISFTCQPYADIKPITFRLRVSVITGGPKPMFTLRIQNDQKHSEDIAKEFKTLIDAGLISCNTDVPVVLGSYEKKQ